MSRDEEVKEYFARLLTEYDLARDRNFDSDIHLVERGALENEEEVDTIHAMDGDEGVYPSEDLVRIRFAELTTREQVAIMDADVAEIAEEEAYSKKKGIDQNLQFSKAINEFSLVRYASGMAYYFVNSHDYFVNSHDLTTSVPITIVHAISGTSYETVAKKLVAVKWTEVPAHVQEEIIGRDVMSWGLAEKLCRTTDTFIHNPPLVEQYWNQRNQSINQSKTTSNMNILGNAKFGKLEDGKLALSVIGIVIRKNDGGYLGYSPETGELTEVGDFIFKMDNAFYLMPATELNVGDLILEDGNYSFVRSIQADGSYAVVGQAGIEYKKLKKNNLLGLQFFAKVVSMWDMLSGKGFGNTLSIGGNQFNPMMFAMMSGDNKGGMDWMTMMMMQQFMQPKVKMRRTKFPRKTAKKRKYTKKRTS